MRPPVFVDTGYLLALEIVSDKNHDAANLHWTSIQHDLPPLVTTTCIFDETVTFLNSWGAHVKAVEVGNRLLSSPSVEMVAAVDETLFDGGWAYFQRRPDKRYSLTDCISFVLTEQRGITAALTFDKHFEQAGFVRVPEQQS